MFTASLADLQWLNATAGATRNAILSRSICHSFLVRHPLRVQTYFWSWFIILNQADIWLCKMYTCVSETSYIDCAVFVHFGYKSWKWFSLLFVVVKPDYTTYCWNYHKVSPVVTLETSFELWAVVKAIPLPALSMSCKSRGSPVSSQLSHRGYESSNRL